MRPSGGDAEFEVVARELGFARRGAATVRMLHEPRVADAAQVAERGASSQNSGESAHTEPMPTAIANPKA